MSDLLKYIEDISKLNVDWVAQNVGITRDDIKRNREKMRIEKKRELLEKKITRVKNTFNKS